ncbi:hypothetical protein L3Y34_005472 [Caenorhabditis briggsae]|uniref:Uncharacterized protein n=1 Tax=Caenorhabditis briggsae TaxID=6238 RepID=A0AAE9AG73_CAEBR|nr:hypothetical protein L3Y34_005472 [Caenorhabditis briggsae]
MIRGLNSPGGLGLNSPRGQPGGPPPPPPTSQAPQQVFYDDEPYQANATRFPFGGNAAKIMEQRRETGNLIPHSQRTMGSATPFGSAPTQSYFGSSGQMSSPRKMQQTHQMLFGNIQPVSF